MTPAEYEARARRKRIVTLKAEMEGRLAALEGGAEWADHGQNIKRLAEMIWDLENYVEGQL